MLFVDKTNAYDGLVENVDSRLMDKTDAQSTSTTSSPQSIILIHMLLRDAREWCSHPLRRTNPGVGSLKNIDRNVRTKELTRIATTSALYVVASFFPLTAFIGGGGFITVGIVILPVIAWMLRPRSALTTAVVSALAQYAFQISTAPIFGLYSLAIPIIAMTLGSIAFHSRKGIIAPWSFVFANAIFYVLYSNGAWFWLLPYLIIIFSLPLALKCSSLRLPLLCLYTTMCELAAMTIGSITILHLPGSLWTIIAGFMFFERGIATAGSYLVIKGLQAAMPNLAGN